MLLLLAVSLLFRAVKLTACYGFFVFPDGCAGLFSERIKAVFWGD